MMKSKEKYNMYRLKVDIPGLSKGALFYHDTDDTIRGSIGCGCLKLAWLDGSCQQMWCGDTFVFPGQLIKDDKFEKIDKKYDKEVNRDKKVMQTSYRGLVITTTIEEDF